MDGHTVCTDFQEKLRAVRDKSGELNSLLVEDIQGNRLIHSFGLMEREKE